MKLQNKFKKNAFYFLMSAVVSSCSVSNNISKYTYPDEGAKKGMEKLSIIYDGNAFYDGTKFHLVGDSSINRKSLKKILKIADSNPLGKKDNVITLYDYYHCLNRIKK